MEISLGGDVVLIGLKLFHSTSIRATYFSPPKLQRSLSPKLASLSGVFCGVVWVGTIVALSLTEFNLGGKVTTFINYCCRILAVCALLLFSINVHAGTECWTKCIGEGNSTKSCAKTCEIKNSSDIKTCSENCLDRGGSKLTCNNLCGNSPVHSSDYCDSHSYDSSCKAGDFSTNYCDTHSYESKCQSGGTHSEDYCDTHSYDSSCKAGDFSKDYCDAHSYESKCQGGGTHSESYCDTHTYDSNCKAGDLSPAYCDSHSYESKCQGGGTHSTEYCDSHSYESSCKAGDFSKAYCDNHSYDSKCK